MFSFFSNHFFGYSRFSSPSSQRRIFCAKVAFCLLLSAFSILLLPLESMHTGARLSRTPSNHTSVMKSKSLNGRTAVCISGGLRTFYRPIVHESILNNFINALSPDKANRDIFFTVSYDNNCVNGRCKDAPEESALPTLAQMNETITTKFNPVFLDIDSPKFTCKHPFIENHQCCAQEILEKQPENFEGWPSLLQYTRRHYCYEEIKKYEKKHNIVYETIAIVRPDLVFFSPLAQSHSYTTFKPILFPNKEQEAQTYADFFWLIPRSHADSYFKAINGLFTNECKENKKVDHGLDSAPEYWIGGLLEDLNIPRQHIPVYYGLVRLNGNVECFRLKNSINDFAKPFLIDGKLKTPEEYCQHLVDNGAFKHNAKPIKFYLDGKDKHDKDKHEKDKHEKDAKDKQDLDAKDKHEKDKHEKDKHEKDQQPAP